MWKERAIRAMRKLDVIIGGINYLDQSMAGIFETEREVYKKYLD
jgi:succinate dehydrogenase flavin-adding protein (antitoxin of CptAB toxin-antitoxin module)